MAKPGYDPNNTEPDLRGFLLLVIAREVSGSLVALTGLSLSRDPAPCQSLPMIPDRIAGSRTGVGARGCSIVLLMRSGWWASRAR